LRLAATPLVAGSLSAGSIRFAAGRKRFSQTWTRGGEWSAFKKTAGMCPAGSDQEQTSWSGFRALVQEVHCLTMPSSAIMERSASHRATTAAGGSAIALRLRRRDIQLSGTLTHFNRQRAWPGW